MMFLILSYVWGIVPYFEKIQIEALFNEIKRISKPGADLFICCPSILRKMVHFFPSIKEYKIDLCCGSHKGTFRKNETDQRTHNLYFLHLFFYRYRISKFTIFINMDY